MRRATEGEVNPETLAAFAAEVFRFVSQIHIYFVGSELPTRWGFCQRFRGPPGTNIGGTVC